MLWCKQRMLAFDVETTGPDPREARIVSATLAEVGGGMETVDQTTLCNPGVEIPAEATAIHGITNEQAANAEPAERVIDMLVTVIKTRPIEQPLVAFNARYDLTVLVCEAKRYGLEFDWSDIGFVVDPFVLDRHLQRYREGSRKLARCCEVYGAVHEEAHESLSDAIAAARLAWVMGMKAGPVRRVRNEGEARELEQLQVHWSNCRHDLALLHASQEGWAAEQAEGLEKHFAKQGKPQRVEPEWPVLDPERPPEPVPPMKQEPAEPAQATLFTGRLTS